MAAELAFDLWDAEDPKGTFLCRYTLGDQLVDAGFHRVLHGTGDGFIDIHGDDADTQYIHRRAWVQVVRIDTTPDEYLGGFFLEEGDFRAISKKGQAGRILHFEGRGGLSIFDRYSLGHSIYAPGQTARGDYDVPDKWHWVEEPYGAMAVRLIEEGKHAPGSPYAPIAYGFTRTRDTDNLLWDELADYETDILTNGLTLISDFMRLGVVFDCSADLLIRASRSVEDFGTDRSSTSFASGKVLLNGQNIANELPKRIAASQAATHVTIRDRTGDYQTVDEDIDGNPLPGPTRYVTLKSSTTADDAAIIKMGQLHLTALQKHSDQCRIQHVIGPGGASGADGYNPGPAGDYDIGDIVTVDTGTGEYDYDEQPLEVAGIRWYFTGTDWMVEVELGGQYFSPAQVQTQAVASSVIRDPGVQLCTPAFVTPVESPALLDAYGNAANGDAHHLLPNFVDATGGGLVFVMMTDTPGGTPSNVRYQPQGTGFTEYPMTLIETIVHPTASSGTNRDNESIYVYWLANPAVSNANGRISFSGGGVGFGLGAWVVDTTDQPTVIANSGNSSTMSVDASSAGTGDLILLAAGWRIWSLSNVSQTPIALSGQSVDWAIAHNAPTGQNDACWAGGHDTGPANYQWNGVTSTNWVAVAIVYPGTGTVIPNDGHADLVGSDTKVARCDHRHDVHRDTAPTVDDDESVGYKVGTIWAQLDDLVTPTEIVAVWVLADASAGAAVWLEWPIGTGSVSSTRWEVVMSGTGGSLAPVTNDAETDWLYAEV